MIAVKKAFLSERQEPVPPDWAKERVNRFSGDRRRVSAFGYALLGELLDKQGVADAPFFREDGKPLCKGAYVSLTHTGALAACAVSDRPVGIDAEYLRPGAVPAVLKLFSPADAAAIHISPHPYRAFLLAWTAKEAYKKAADCGWEEVARLDFLRDGALVPELFGFRFETEIRKGYIVTVAAAAVSKE